MVQLEHYIREILWFLKTVTLKNTYYADQMLQGWVNPVYRNLVTTETHPYYRHLNGEYILSAAGLEQARSLMGLPTEQECNEWLRMERYPTKYTAVEKAGVAERTRKCWEMFGDGSGIVLSSLNSRIVSYLQDTYGLTKTVLIDKNDESSAVPTDIFYTRFDSPVVIQSFDNKKPLPFTRKALALRGQRKTKIGYRIPSTHTDQLIAQHPDEFPIIRSVLYPIESLTQAETAENYALLGCDLEILEPMERTSIYFALEKTLAYIRQRWDVKEFVYEDLYPQFMEAKIWMALFLTILRQRVRNIRTSEAHSFHIWNYLGSYGISDCEDILSSSQAVFLYKNLPYLMRNRGSDRNLVLLARKLLYELGLTVHDKVIQQEYTTTKEQAKHHPVPKTREIEPKVAIAFKDIEHNEPSYYNKTQKPIDEYEAIQYNQHDSEIIDKALEEELDYTYDKERISLLEYQEDPLFKNATKQQTKELSYTPHGLLPTKLLELRGKTELSADDELYLRFVTESILYNISIGRCNGILRLNFDDEIINLTPKELLVLFYYCEAKADGVCTDRTKIPTSARVTLPYITEFQPIDEEYIWYKAHRPMNTQLSIIPDVIRVEFGPELEMFNGDYRLEDWSLPRKNWRWTGDNGVVMSYKSKDDGGDGWTLLASADIGLVNEALVPYVDWTCWRSTWKIGNHSYEGILRVVSRHYVMDEEMPNHTVTMYYDEQYPEVSLMHLVQKQALAYCKIMSELNVSGLSRQHSAVWWTLDQRCYHGDIPLNLSEYETFSEFLDTEPEIADMTARVERMLVSRPDGYAELANAAIQTLYPLADEYMSYTTKRVNGALTRLKNLLMQLCSYNVVFIENAGAEIHTAVAGTCGDTLDYIGVCYGKPMLTYLEPDTLVSRTGVSMETTFRYNSVMDTEYYYENEGTPRQRLAARKIPYDWVSSGDDVAYLMTTEIRYQINDTFTTVPEENDGIKYAVHSYMDLYVEGYVPDFTVKQTE